MAIELTGKVKVSEAGEETKEINFQPEGVNSTGLLFYPDRNHEAFGFFENGGSYKVTFTKTSAEPPAKKK